MELGVAMTYAEALYGAARDLGHISEVSEEIVQIDRIVRNNTDLTEFMINPAVPLVHKKEVIKNVFDGKVLPETMNFLCILLDKNRYYDFHAIVREYQKIEENEMGVADGVIYSVVPLTEEQLNSFNQQASGLLHKKVKLRNKIDRSLIGGVKLFVDGKLIDASMSSRLEKLADRIRNN